MGYGGERSTDREGSETVERDWHWRGAAHLTVLGCQLGMEERTLLLLQHDLLMRIDRRARIDG